MRTKRGKLGAVAAAAIIVLAWIGLDRRVSTVWSMEQTIAAVKELKSLYIRGTEDCSGEPVPFECWIRLTDKGSNGPRIRYERKGVTLVNQGGVAYKHYHDENFVRVLRGADVRDLKFWYKTSTLSPLLTGKIVETLQLFTDDWKQFTTSDPKTGRQQVHVTCSYRPSKISILFVVDVESKLVERGSMYYNLTAQGTPEYDAHEFVYNQEIPDAIFEFQVPATAKVVVEGSESDVLANKAMTLYREEGKHAEAIELFKEVHERFPNSYDGKMALVFIAICQSSLGQHDEAIQSYHKAVQEYPWRDHLLEIAYFSLGRLYMERGQPQAALKAFESCLTANEEHRNPDSKRLRMAREYIANIRGKQGD
ncbi:MAG: tetratricopeptide repeat protein [Phycisphaerales bacterium]|nr:MAG: tetratricopeptide repeat protein [Phycisphaerales bacterium]